MPSLKHFEIISEWTKVHLCADLRVQHCANHHNNSNFSTMDSLQSYWTVFRPLGRWADQPFSLDTELFTIKLHVCLFVFASERFTYVNTIAIINSFLKSIIPTLHVHYFCARIIAITFQVLDFWKILTWWYNIRWIGRCHIWEIAQFDGFTEIIKWHQTMNALAQSITIVPVLTQKKKIDRKWYCRKNRQKTNESLKLPI